MDARLFERYSSPSVAVPDVGYIHQIKLMDIPYSVVMPTPCQSMPAFIQLAAHPLRWQLITALSSGDHRVRELAARTHQPQNLISYHLRLLRDSGLIASTRSSHDRRDSYYHLNLQHCADQLAAAGPALHPGLHMTPSPPTDQLDASASVLFVCTGNSARSPIAEALLRHHVGERLHVTSAGTKPRNYMHTNTSRVLRQEYGIDITGQQPRHLNRVDTANFTHIITLCDKARENCPDFNNHPGHHHWSIPDPATANHRDSYPAFQHIANEINTRVHYLQATLRQSHPTAAKN